MSHFAHIWPPSFISVYALVENGYLCKIVLFRYLGYVEDTTD